MDLSAWWDDLNSFLTAACDHFEQSAPTVRDHCDDLYIRIVEKPEAVTMLEIIRIAGLRDGETWEHPNYAANRVYKLRSALGMDTAGQAGF